MIQEHIDITVAARPETVLEVLKDVESVDGWLRPLLPAWPKIASSMTVVESFQDGSPRLVRTVTSAFGISDDALTEYEWFPDGCRLTLIESRTLRHNVSQFTIIPDDPQTRLTADVSLDLKIRLPGLLERQLKKSQVGFIKSFQQGLAAESARRELACE
ncbi:SRPBCC family protein [Mycobacterium sp. NPDC050853]|uniref:SRPBCC family protein n=1 Tax=Mycobacteriaceae TaxID=1762 RepID=UPI0015DF6A4D|nr:SRPBCC family protein [Mycobacteroides sp. LB1]